MWEGSSVWWWVEEFVWMVVGGGVRDRELHCAAIALVLLTCLFTLKFIIKTNTILLMCHAQHVFCTYVCVYTNTCTCFSVIH